MQLQDQDLVQFHSHWTTDGFGCVFQLFNHVTPPTDCTTLHYLFPPAALTRPPYLYPVSIDRTAPGQDVGKLSWCNIRLTADESGIRDTWLKDQTAPRADVWWFCGGKTLGSKLPRDWKGTCALVQLVVLFYTLPITDLTPVKDMIKAWSPLFFGSSRHFDITNISGNPRDIFI